MTGSGDIQRGHPRPARQQPDRVLRHRDRRRRPHRPPNRRMRPTDVFTLAVTQAIYTFTAEDPGDPDWAIGAADDAADSGIWVRADPVGTVYNGIAVQPEDDHTPAPGVACFVTGNGAVGGAAGDADVDHGCTTLFSPVFDLSPRTSAPSSPTGAGTARLATRPTTTSWSRCPTTAARAGSSSSACRRSRTRGRRWPSSWVRSVGGFDLTDQVQVRFRACDLAHAGPRRGRDRRLRDRDLTLTSRRPRSTPVSSPRPAVVLLHQNQPNPFNPSTTIAFSLPQATVVKLGSTPSTAAASRSCWTSRCRPARTVSPGTDATRAAARWRRARTSTG